MSEETRIDSEWLALNAFRELLKIATKGDMAKSTYDEALEFGGELYPELLGAQTSVLRRVRESETTKEYRQRAMLMSRKAGVEVLAVDLVATQIEEIEGLLTVAARSKDISRVAQLKRRLKSFKASHDELSPVRHSENQLIFRDAYVVDRRLPELGSGRGYRDFTLPDENVLRVRVLHPDIPEHVTGADILYERHSPNSQEASLVVIQYKLWDNRSLSLSDPRMQEQLQRMERFACEAGLCANAQAEDEYRFPHCAAFLRPTDRLQTADQKLITSGEHLPICKIGVCATTSRMGTPVLKYKKIKETSLAGEAFEYLFTAGKVGSRMVGYDELAQLYERYKVESRRGQVVVHAQELRC